MKKYLIATTIVVLFQLVTISGIEAQTSKTTLDQNELMKQFVGTWQSNYGKDTLAVAEVQLLKKAFLETDYFLVNGKKLFINIWSFGFSPEENQFKVFELRADGKYNLWNAAFTSEKVWYLNRVGEFSSKEILAKAEITFDTPGSMTVNYLKAEGGKDKVLKFIKLNK